MSIAVITVIKYSNNGKKIVPDPMYNSAPLWRSQLPSHKMMLANLDLPCNPVYQQRSLWVFHKSFGTGFLKVDAAA